MADPARGHRFYLQLGKEAAATYGTVVAATGVRLWGYNFKAKPNLGVDEEESLYGGLSIREVHQLGRFWEWEFEMDLSYLGQLKLWNMIMGDDTAPATPAVTGPDANGIYTHTFKVGLTMPSFSAEVLEGGAGAVTTVSSFNGFQVEKFSISGQAGVSSSGRLRAKISGIARNRATGVTAAALTLINPRPVLYRHASIVDDGSADAATDVLVRGWSLDIMSPIDRERFAFGNIALLSKPARTKHFRAVMSFDQEFQTETQYTNFVNNADLSPEMEFTGPELVGASGARTIKFTMNRSKILDLDVPVDRFGILRKQIQHLGQQNTADVSSLIVTVKTDQATIVLG